MTTNYKNSANDKIEAFLLILAFAVLAIEVAALYNMGSGIISLIDALAVHLSLVIALSGWLYLMFKRQNDIKMPVFLWLFFTATGPFGAIGGIITILLHLLYTQKAIPFSEWFASLFPEDTSRSTDIYERLHAGWDDFSDKRGIIAFADVISFGTEDQKRAVVAKMANHFKPEFAPALLMATKDNSNPIRVQAATAIAKLERDYSKILIDMEQKRKKDPEDITQLLNLARHCDIYAHCGIVDKEREEDFRNKAIGYYKEYLKVENKDKNVKFILGRLYVSCGKPQKAYDLLKNHTEDNEALHPQVMLWYMKSLFSLRKFSELRTYARKYYSFIDVEDSKSHDVLEMMKLWSNGNRA